MTERREVRGRSADDAAVGARRRPGASGPRRTGSSTCGRSTATSCGRSRTSSTARSSPRRGSVKVGPMVTNPATRDWTVTASRVRHAQRDVRQPHRVRHRPRRLRGAGHERRADDAGDAAREHPRHPRARQRAQRRLQGLRSCACRGRPSSECEVWVAAYGPKALALTGEVGDGFILQLADLSIAEWTIGAVRDAAKAAGRDPDDDHHLRRRAGVRHRRHARRVSPTAATSAAGSAAWSATTSPTSSPATASDTSLVPAGAHRLHQGPPGLRLQRARPGRQRPHELRARRDRRPLLHRRPGRTCTSSGWRS